MSDADRIRALEEKARKLEDAINQIKAQTGHLPLRIAHGGGGGGGGGGALMIYIRDTYTQLAAVTPREEVALGYVRNEEQRYDYFRGQHWKKVSHFY